MADRHDRVGVVVSRGLQIIWSLIIESVVDVVVFRICVYISIVFASHNTARKREGGCMDIYTILLYYISPVGVCVWEACFNAPRGRD